MDGIQPYAGPPRPPALASPSFSVTPTLAKTPSDYLRALRRRVWLVLAVSVPLAVALSVLALKQPAVYRASVQIQIQPPQYDPVLSTLVSHDVGRREGETLERYIPNRLALLKSKPLIDQVVNSPEIVQPAAPGDDPAEEILANLVTKPLMMSNYISNYVTVSLEGTDPARTAKQLELLLRVFRDRSRDEIQNEIEASKDQASGTLKNMWAEYKKLNEHLYSSLKGSTTVGPGGKNILEEQWLMMGSMLAQKRARLDEMKQQALIAQLFPSANRQGNSDLSARQGMLRELEAQRKQLQRTLQTYKRKTRHFESDPAVVHKADLLKDVVDQIEQIRSAPLEASEDSSAAEPLLAMTQSMDEQIKALEQGEQAILARFQESMPEHQKYLNDLEERQMLRERIADMETKLSEFEILAKSQKDPVVIPTTVPEPTAPVRPKRALNIALALAFSLALGIGLVCLLEFLDHSVKVPEHLSMGLTLPLFGVVPRIRRTALTHRGGHLWTPGAPESVEADAYRNLRASLLGATDKRGPITTLLVTSAKAAEGKSTTALNLAATCARAGERTLLMDVDLRRPSLNEVFVHDGHDLGLVDALRGEIPWQRALVRTDIPNLDFLPTGDTRDIPIEILGTLELRQLLLAVSSHYDRVILDGPAVLGLADCRMLGRIVDAALLVVRSGSHGLQPLLRAKSMLEQSHVVIAGVVFNGLFEDLKNWSSYGPYQPYGDGFGRASEGLGTSSRTALPV
ncbi:MAG: polysaccharide biosynthesis tyrosine autokinase [Isosphaeraceae bacterium]|nr:polysaccharide biosynthesis tyrosine autokinase [Isosphaeraceae bacterium]